MRVHRVITALALTILIPTPAVRAISGPAPACSAAKRTAVGKKALDRMKCEADGQRRGAVDPACIQRVEERFQRAFDRAEQKAERQGSCQTIGDANALESLVDEFVADAVDALTGGTTSTTTSTTTTLPSACPGGGFEVSDRFGIEHCWYLGGLDCDAVCAAAERIYDPATATFAGSDGDDIGCLLVLPTFALAPLSGLDFVAARFVGSQDCAASGLEGIGCFVKSPPAGSGLFALPTYGRCATPPTVSAVSPDSAPLYRRFCACQ
jgi:hypothetical protein